MDLKEPSTATDETRFFQEVIKEKFLNSPLTPDEKLFNPFLHVRASVLVKALVMDDLYRRIVNIPGALIEFGCWYGQNLVLLENLRAIHEPFNKARKIIGFDSFNGYEDGSYAAGGDYVPTLLQLLRAHEGANAFGHVCAGHEIVVGDVTETAPKYFDKHRKSVALALFDMGPYEPTLAALKALDKCFVRGSVILFDEFTTSGEVEALDNVYYRDEYEIEVCKLYPSKTIVTIRK